eukprot:CAMPEP_0170159348 /NCGR_PEP_ID=MMETSP0033_2-20121228/70581_1 /TAXON_ID=195969 /ORGANISM="Dolichomastix tenuilepis, Strain CCMP3274" /LENGTH=70 /DNA_ID=CAMNT_0010396825 /DNA_START=20 /DNA_END=228 /DNA_ORIENTATION=-
MTRFDVADDALISVGTVFASAAVSFAIFSNESCTARAGTKLRCRGNTVLLVSNAAAHNMKTTTGKATTGL